MKLRNKKTGEIGYLIVGRGSNHYVVSNNEWDSCGKYDSLAELNAEWEDYEEPKEYWYINFNLECIKTTDDDTETDGYHKLIGNCFETKEEAKKAVEKLKAVKRLKDKGFRFSGWQIDQKKHLGVITIKTEPYYSFEFDDLDLLFSGGEE